MTSVPWDFGDALQKAISALGLIGALLFALAAGYRRVWVWGHHYREVCKQRDIWMAAALKLLAPRRSADLGLGPGLDEDPG